MLVVMAGNESMKEYGCDLVIDGGGGAGLPAAYGAAELGARLLLLEASDRPGCSLAPLGVVFYAGDTSDDSE